MADNTSKTALTTKQKIISVLLVIIIGFIIYEVIGLFSSSNNATPVVTPVAHAPTANKKTMSAAMPTAGQPATAANGGMQPSSQQPTLTTVNALTPPATSTDLQKQQMQQQQSYLDSVNQLQLLKVKREIAETNQAIAAARLATETANKNMSDLLTQPAILPQAPGGDVNKVTGQTIIQGVPQSTENMPPIKPQVLDIPFVVISVSMQFSRWSAVLGYQDKLYSVSIGDSLFDGSKVISISKNGVTLIKDGKRRKISIQTTI